MPKPIFISHASVDGPIVDRVVDLLNTAMGIDVQNMVFCSSLEGMKIPGGKDFKEFIKEEIQKPQIVLLLISPNYLASAFCLAEAGASWAMSHRIIPFLIPPAKAEDMKAVLAGIHALRIEDAGDWNEALETFREVLKIGPNLNRWERKRDEKIGEIKELMGKELKGANGGTAPSVVLPGSQERKKLRFTNELKADPVGVKFAVNAAHEREVLYEIIWPEATWKYVAYVKQLLVEVEDHHSTTSRFHGEETELLSNIAESLQLALPRAEKILACAGHRIPKLLKGMNGYWGRLDSPQEHALANYLALANMRVLESMLYPLRYNILYEALFPKQFESWFRNSSPKAAIKQVFEITEPIYTTHVIKVENKRVDNYYWGPSSTLVGAYRMSTNLKPLTNPWYARYLIPQVELDLAILESNEIIFYREQAMLSKVMNENGDEINPYTDEIVD